MTNNLRLERLKLDPRRGHLVTSDGDPASDGKESDMSTTEDRSLWEPNESGPVLASKRENNRIRNLFLREISENVRQDTRDIPTGRKYGDARGTFASEWVLLAQQLGIKTPGDPRTPKRDDDHRRPTHLHRRVDAAATALRQFREGRDLSDWQLLGIECVINDRRGYALPPKAYQVQRTLV